MDARFLDTPGLAVEQSRNVAESMAKLAQESMVLAMGLLDQYDEETATRVVMLEDEVDKFEDVLGSYLVKLSTKELSHGDSHIVNNLLHSISDFERISDHARNIKESAEEIFCKNLRFSDEAGAELATFRRAINDILGVTTQCFIEEDLQLAEQVEPMEEVIDGLNLDIRQRHVKRLQRNECTIELGFVLSDILTNLERVSDHCSNIALCMLEIAQDSLEMHDYQQRMREEDMGEYKRTYEAYMEKYKLPAKDAAMKRAVSQTEM